MKKKLFKSALFAAAAFVSSIASATITYDNSVTDAIKGTYAQTDNAVVTAGGGAVRANDLILRANTGATDMPADSEIIIRLPAGLNFDGEPSYLVGPITPTQGLTLKDGTEFGDPTLDDPAIEMFDTNGDGGYDRALVTVAAASGAGDTLTISINLTADADVSAGVKKASVIVNNGLAVTQNIVEVIAADVDPLGNTGDPVEVSQGLNESVDTSSATFAVTIPAGTAGGKTITLTPASGVQWATAAGSTTVTWTIHSPFSVNPLSPVVTANVSVNAASATVTAASSTATITLATNWATDETNDSPIQVNLSIAAANSLDGKTGLRKVTVAGTAGIDGTVSLFDALENGSEATISATGPDAPEIVAGSSAAQTLPTIDVTENFDGDLGGSFTITAGTGLTFISGGASVPAGSATITVNASSTVITVTVVANGPASSTISISGITAIADEDASGDLSVTVDSDGQTGNKYGPKNDKLVVAEAVHVGAVQLSVASAQVMTVGTDGTSRTSTITLEEETYGAISIANATQINDAYFRLTPTSNADITNVRTTTAGYNAGTSPTITACVAETGVTTGAWLCEITAESTNVQVGTSTISVHVTYTSDSASVGDTIDITFDGNSRVAGTVTVANVKIATTATVTGVIPDITPGNKTATSLATITITENFSGAIDAGGTKSIRIIAPTGVAFQDAASSVNATVGGTTATITATFSPNDTLILNVTSSTITLDTKAIVAAGLEGLLTFEIVDGDIDGANGAGVTGEEVIIAYAGDLDALDAGDDGDVNVGFSISNTVTGGLVDYTVASDDTAIATVSVNGSVVTVTGKSAGVATITVTDGLNATDSFDVTVADGAAQPEAAKVTGIGGDVGNASFTAGASSDGGTTYATEFTTSDEVTLVATVNVSDDDQGLNGEIHVAILSIYADGTSSLVYLDEDGGFPAWDGTVAGLGAAEVAEPLGATHSITIHSGTLLAGTHRVAVAYSTEDGKLVFTPKAMVITVTE
jgi:hypothetical protein